MNYKKQWKLFKKEFNYRDGTFLALIGVLCIALVTLNITMVETQEDVCWEMLKRISNSKIDI
jgi:hypothetical protein